MARIVRSVLLAACLGGAIGAVPAQQLNQPASAPRPAATRSTAVSPTIARPAAVPSDPGQRAGTTSPIQSAGPSVTRPTTAPIKPVPQATPVSPARVRDADGRLIPGAVQVSPGRAYDPATGRYHRTAPTSTPR